MPKMTDEQYENLYENFESRDLLAAIKKVDFLRRELADGYDLRPPEIRQDLFKLHDLAMDVINNGYRNKANEMFNLAFDIEYQVDGMMESLEELQTILRNLTKLTPDPDLMLDDEEVDSPNR